MLVPAADRGTSLFGPRRRRFRKGCSATRRTITPSVLRERRRGSEGWGKERVIDKKNGVYYPATAEEGVTSRRDAVGMFSQAERRSPVAIVAREPLSPARGIHSYPPAIGVIYAEIIGHDREGVRVRILGPTCPYFSSEVPTTTTAITTIFLGTLDSRQRAAERR